MLPLRVLLTVVVVVDNSSLSSSTSTSLEEGGMGSAAGGMGSAPLPRVSFPMLPQDFAVLEEEEEEAEEVKPKGSGREVEAAKRLRARWEDLEGDIKGRGVVGALSLDPVPPPRALLGVEGAEGAAEALGG